MPTPSLAAIAAHIEICNAKSRHIRLLDTGELDAYAEMLTDDYELDISAVAPLPVVKGRDAAMRVVRQMMTTVKVVHHVHMPSIEIDGDVAHATWPMQDITVSGPDQPRLLGYGYHHDRWVRQDGGWKCAASRLSRLHSEPLLSSRHP
jgi:ketosteroid isomerase-like protein